MESPRSFRSQIHSAATFATALYLASALEQETVGCRFDDHETSEASRKMQNPDVECRVSGQPAQSASEYAVMVSSEDVRRYRLSDIMPWTYYSIRCSIVMCGTRGWCMWR